MNRFSSNEIDKKDLAAIGAYWQHSLLSLEQALEPVIFYFDQLDRSIREAKRRCHHPSEHELTRDESAAVVLYSMGGGDNSFYRILNEILRSENRRAVKPWFGFLKLFDTALAKLPTVRRAVWRGTKGNVSHQFNKGEILTWWSINSCSLSLKVVEQFLGEGTNSTLLMIEAKNAKDVRGYTDFTDEKEVILKPGTQLVVEDNALRRGDLIIVHLIEVDNDEEQSGKNKVSSAKSEHRRTTGTTPLIRTSNTTSTHSATTNPTTQSRRPHIMPEN